MKASKKTTSLNNHVAAKGGFNLPSHDALARILPNYCTLFKGERTELHRAGKQEEERPAVRPEAAQANKPNINHTYHVRHPRKRPPLHDFKDDPHTGEIANLQTKEVENFRSAMSKMAEDIVALRTQVVTLEAENNQLHIDLSLHQDLGRGLLDDTDIDVMTKAELADRIASLKFKLASETSKAASQRDRIQQLQKDLNQKNNSENELLKFQTVQQQQHVDLQHHQCCLANMATLEATVKQQEKIIEKMEKVSESKLSLKNKQTGDKKLVATMHRGETDDRKEEMESVLAEENTRLREELDRFHQHPVPSATQQAAQVKDVLPLKEGLSLLSKLERAEARVQTLEARLEENSKLWGKQKQEMLTKLSEHRHGFAPTSTAIRHNVASSSASESFMQNNSQRKQKPAK